LRQDRVDACFTKNSPSFCKGGLGWILGNYRKSIPSGVRFIARLWICFTIFVVKILWMVASCFYRKK
ncbi:MAG TPA: hypothetical protein P5150_09240, partial [Candidatus Ratteibacteria bacterium]|nr:hypothetical protein [Candidatus Ratteibacteria bacterium]